MRLIAFDTETYLIGKTEKAPKPVCCSWFDQDKAWLTHPGEPATYALLADLDNVFIGTNIPYDIIVMLRWYPHMIPLWIRALDEGRVHDISLRETMIYLATTGAKGLERRMSLAHLAQKYLNKDITATKKDPTAWRMRFGTLDGVPFNEWPADALDYVLADARMPMEIFLAQGGTGIQIPTEALQAQAGTVLNAISTYGFGIDLARRNELGIEIQAKIDAATVKVGHLKWTGEGSVKRMGDVVMQGWHMAQSRKFCEYAAMMGVAVDTAKWWDYFKPNADLQSAFGIYAAGGPYPPIVSFVQPEMAQAFFAEAAKIVPTIPMTSRGPSTAEELLEPIVQYVPDLAAYFALKHQQKMLSTYIEPYVNDTIHPSFTTMVSTGRTGSDTPNAQNIPRGEGFRTMFKARDGRVLGTSDYSQLELCTLAATIDARFPGVHCKLKESIDKGIDVHCLVGEAVSGMPYAELKPKSKVKGSKEAEIRQSAKPASFGRPGGLGVDAFVAYAKNNYGVTLSRDDGQRALAAVDRVFPEVKIYLRANSNLVRERGVATGFTLTGRAKANCIYTEISNYTFQGLAADGAKAALWGIWKEIMLAWYYSRYPGTGWGWECAASPLRDSRIVNFIHDEIVGEHPQGDAGKAALKRQDEIMVAEMTRICQNRITIRVESALSDRWEH